MRRAVLGLLAAAGCNQIWGLDPVDLRPPVDAPDAGVENPRIRLTTQITRTMDLGKADLAVDYGPISPAPALQLGLLDDTFALQPATYDSVDGTVEYPAEFAGQPWRLLYTLADGIPREVHWSPPPGDLLGHIVDPLFGRAERLPVEPGAGYSITPLGSPAQHTLTRVFTTGIWTEGVFTGTSAGATFNYDFSSKAVSLSGPLGAPEAARFDHAVLADFQNTSTGTGTCRLTTGVATFVVPNLVAGTMTPPAMQPDYVMADKTVLLTLAGPSIDVRLQQLLGARVTNGTDILRMEYGYLPSVSVFGFSKLSASPFFLPSPRMITLASCTFSQGTATFSSPAFADSPELGDLFTRAVHVEVVNQRTRGVLALSSGFSAVVTSPDLNFSSGFLVAAPTRVKLLRGGVEIADLEDVSKETEPLPAGTGTVELAFDVESGAQLVSHSFDIVLYAVQGGNLQLQRVYTVTDRKLKIDPSFLLANTEYVFEIRAYHGRPDIGRANFAINSYPQFSASIFTRTFLTP